jgi:hypothetical protein
MRRGRSLAAAVALAVLGGGIAVLGTAGPAAAACPANDTCTQGATVTAVVGGTGLVGTRSITTATVGTLTPGTSTLTGALNATVAENVVAGDNPWSVTATSSNLTDTNSDTIAASNLSAGTTTAPTGVGCLLVTSPCTVTAGSGGSLGSAQTLYSVSGENPSDTYTGDYASVTPLTLTVPNGTPTGTYTGTVTVTLVQ